MSEEKSGIDFEVVEGLFEVYKLLITPKVAPNNYIAAMAITLGYTAAKSTMSKERLREHVYKLVETAFDTERERVLTLPEARKKLEEWESRHNRNTVN